MRAVAERGVLRVLAGAPRHFFRLGDHHLLGGEAGAFVRTITERLVLRIAAGTPVVGSGGHVFNDGGFLGDVGLVHGRIGLGNC